jgi:hypothetical protein
MEGGRREGGEEISSPPYRESRSDAVAIRILVDT